jgi:2-keto-4-pentenoate hydratase/2-oxohepta-3-ene-1,7-dioic acid hydratase in catechol pathway
MYLATMRDPQGGAGAGVAAVGDDSGWVLLDVPDVRELITRPDWRRLAERALAGSAERLLDDQVELLVPLATPSKILCCGLNYRDHIAETGRETPQYPTLFAKFADTLLPPYANILITEPSRVDWEAELVVVVGREVFRADREAAEQAILGYTVANDISMRDWQQRTLQWLQGKAFDGTTPLGPRIVTADAIDPRAGLRIECRVNDEVVQQSSTGELVFDAAHLIQYVSRFTRLVPGDMILTGTPGGVALGMENPKYLRDGDTVTTSVEGIGELRNTIRFVA